MTRSEKYLELVGSGGPAFPFTEFQDNGARCDAYGMTLRDYFAAKALPNMLRDFPNGTSFRFENAANFAYKMADAMLEARKK